MKELVITDNSSESLILRWDGWRFALVHKTFSSTEVTKTIILSVREMSQLVAFVTSLKGKEKEDES